MTDLKKYNWIFFDADNTLFDFDTSSALAFEQLVKKLGIPQDPDLYKIYQKHNATVWNLFEEGKISSTDLRSERFDLFFEDISFKCNGLEANNLYLKYLVANVKLWDGAVSLLERLRGLDKKMLIITNGLKEVQKPRLEKVNLTGFFHDIIVSDEIGVAKPNEGFFKIAHQAANTPSKAEVLVVGDSLKSDILGGNLFGYDTCWFNPSKKSNKTDIQSLHEIEKLDSILSLV